MKSMMEAISHLISVRPKISQKVHESAPTPVRERPAQPMTPDSIYSLPPELRAQIWAECLPPPRLLTLGAAPIDYNEPRPIRNTLLPALLAVSHESRAAMLRHYAIIKNASHGRYAAFDTKRDCVNFVVRLSERLEWPYWYVDANGEDREWYFDANGAIKDKFRIRRAVIDDNWLSSGRYERQEMEYAMLDELIIVLKRGFQSGYIRHTWEPLPHDIGFGERFLERGKKVTAEPGWGSAEAQNNFLNWLDDLKEKHGLKGPVVKVVHMGSFLAEVDYQL